MKPWAFILGLAMVSPLFWCGCANAPGRSFESETPVAPSEITDFDYLFSANCAGCHGLEGRGGAAIALGNPVYLAIVDNETLDRVASGGIPGTSMPAFAQSAGGMLTERQVGIIVKGMRERWSKPDALGGATPPPYSSNVPGDSTRGLAVYAKYCSSCHGADGRGGTKAGSIVDGSFLALVRDQQLRTMVIVGRPELGAPDWRNNIPGSPMSAQEISDVVAWLSSQRPRFPGEPYRAKSTGEVR